jgi:hypothetical protein
LQDHASRTPEAGSPATWYGSAIHDAIDAVEDGHSDDQAIGLAWGTWGCHLLPGDLALLKDDLAEFHRRDGTFGEVRTILAEGEIQIPLCTLDDGTEVSFRGRIDRLYERTDRPGHFVHVDYKSGKWIKTQAEIEEDLQLWAYNLLICEYFPEVEELEQWMDQLRGGLGEPIRKTPAERDEIREWLCAEARNYFTQQAELQEDGLPVPKFNQWCPYCAIAESCPIIPRLTDWALSRIQALRPEGLDEVEVATAATPIDDYFAEYDDVQTAIKLLKRYEESAKTLLHQLPEDEHARLGFSLRERKNSSISVQSRDALYRELGHERFMELARVTQERLSSIEDEDLRIWALSLVEKTPGNRVVYRQRR